MRELERDALRIGVHQTFAIAHSHYDDTIALDLMSEGYVPGYDADALEGIEAAVAPLAHDLADRIAEVVLPPRGN